jgi:hypothetical protein
MVKKRGIFSKQVLLVLGVIILACYSSYVLAAENVVPQGPDTITISESGRRDNSSAPVAIQARAGNVTALVISHETVTQAWQGYYGNITGTIVLDDGNNFTMYDWAVPDPTGEIYASNGSNVDWAKIYCMNTSTLRNNNGTQSEDLADQVYYKINSTQIELNFGINLTDLDGLNETFFDTYTDTTGFRVGAITIDADDGCSLAHPYTDESYNTAWEELLLTDNTSLVFTSIIRQSKDGFMPGDTDTFDFQMLVLENGHPGSDTVYQDYYFYVELA